MSIYFSEEYYADDTAGQLRERVEKHDTNRVMLMWQYHSNVKSLATYFINVVFLYDKAVYFTEAETG